MFHRFVPAAAGPKYMNSFHVGDRLPQPVNTSIDASDILSIDSDYGSSLASSMSNSMSNTERKMGRSSLADSIASLITSVNVTDSEQLEQLDRENAHFSLSENIIETYEAMKCEAKKNISCSVCTNATANNSVQVEPQPKQSQHAKSKQMVRYRRQRRQGLGSDSSRDLSLASTSISSMDNFSEDASEAIATDESFQHNSENDFIQDDEVDEVTEELDVLDNSGYLSSIRETGLSLSNTSLFSMNSETGRQSVQSRQSIASSIAPVDQSNTSSAEWIAYNLIRKISRQNAGTPELQWVINESDEVPQEMLPLPNATCISPDDQPDHLKKIRMRGTLDWAPLRNQVIFHIQPRVARKVQIVKQNYRCAGCGIKVEKKYESRMLYCHYTGKYFCRYNCHSSQRTTIPAMVLNKWDFNQYAVSNFAFNLIDKFRHEQLFNIIDVNSNLYKKSRALQRVTDLRCQLGSLRDYVAACKRGHNVLLGFLLFSPKHFANSNDVHTYSLEDLILIKSDPKLVDRMTELVKCGVSHVSKCQFCSAKGFFCEVCTSNSRNGRHTPNSAVKDVIFPFEVGRVTVCPKCRSAYHTRCFINCLKCDRIQRRRNQAKNQDVHPIDRGVDLIATVS